MIATVHVVVGVAVGTALRRPWLAWPAAYASHLLLDRLPHLDPHALVGVPDGPPTRREILWGTADGLVAIGVGLWLVWDMPRAWVLAGSAFFAALPDVLCWPWLDWGRASPTVAKVHRLHQLAHCPSRPAGWLLGFGTQVATVAVAAAVILLLSP